MKTHEYANIFPLMEGVSFQELKSDIKKQGLLESIKTFEGKIIDGRNRYKACIETGIQPKFEEYTGSQPLSYVVSLNLQRRHLNESQRASIALETLPLFEKEAKQRSGTRTDLGALMQQGSEGRAVEKAGTTFQVSPRYVNYAKKIQAQKPEVLKEITEGKKTISEVIRQLRTEDIQKEKQEIDSGKIEMPQGVFEVIVADPPWPYNTEKKYNPEGYRGTTPYPEMSLEQIKNIQIPSADNCILWLWTTHKFMRHAFNILDSWGFREVSILTWAKNKMGTGRWLRSKSEHCIMAVKGKPQVLLTNQTTILHADTKEHSRKPNEFYKMVETLCVGRKLDVFARQTRQGWEVYGNDVNKW
tara:strand:+ start:82 stop:1155 length:1074 start_codon:yes stop_codon:yes gene_type:complete